MPLSRVLAESEKSGRMGEDTSMSLYAALAGAGSEKRVLMRATRGARSGVRSDWEDSLGGPIDARLSLSEIKGWLNDSITNREGILSEANGFPDRKDRPFWSLSMKATGSLSLLSTRTTALAVYL